MAWFGTGSGPRGLVMFQQQDAALAVRGLLVGLPASTTARIRLHAGTCAALGAKVLAVRAAANRRGSAEPRAVLTRTEGTLLSLDAGNGALTLRIGGTVRRCDDIAVWPDAHRVIPGMGLPAPSGLAGTPSPANEDTVTGLSFLGSAAGSGARAIVFVQQNLGVTTDRIGMFAVLDDPSGRGGNVTVCTSCGTKANRRVLGSVTRTALSVTTHPADTLLGYDASGAWAGIGPWGDLLVRGRLVIYSLSNDEQLPSGRPDGVAAAASR
jgi:hypothetical protein